MNDGKKMELAVLESMLLCSGLEYHQQSVPIFLISHIDEIHFVFLDGRRLGAIQKMRSGKWRAVSLDDHDNFAQIDTDKQFDIRVHATMQFGLVWSLVNRVRKAQKNG